MDLLTKFQNYSLPAVHEDEAFMQIASKLAQDIDPQTGLRDLENLWNSHLLELIAIEAKHSEHIKYLEKFKEEHYFLIPKLYFATLGRFINSADTVRLSISQGLAYKLFFVGWKLHSGEVIVTGSVGSFADEAGGTAKLILKGDTETCGTNIEGNANVQILGNVLRGAGHNAHGDGVIEVHGDVKGELGQSAYENIRFIISGNVNGSVGQHAKDNASFVIKGSAAVASEKTVGNHASGNANFIIGGDAGIVGVDSTDNISVLVKGNAGDYTGYGAQKNAHIKIEGNAGDHVGEKARGNAQIEILGSAGKFVGHRAYGKATIVVSGEGKMGIPNKSFSGRIEINQR